MNEEKRKALIKQVEFARRDAGEPVSMGLLCLVVLSMLDDAAPLPAQPQTREGSKVMKWQPMLSNNPRAKHWAELTVVQRMQIEDLYPNWRQRELEASWWEFCECAESVAAPTAGAGCAATSLISANSSSKTRVNGVSDAPRPRGNVSDHRSAPPVSVEVRKERERIATRVGDMRTRFIHIDEIIAIIEDLGEPESE